jgi:predicted acylesterase/phospholipase RssA
MIEHLVISGGGQTGLAFYGILRESEQRGFWSAGNIKSIYATSVGSFLAVLIALQYDWPTADNYIINRPWHTIFKVDIYSVMQAFGRRGILGVDIMEQMLGPLFAGKDIPLGITLGEFYELTGIELYFMTTELNAFELVKVSHLTHSDWRVVDAVYASCTLPILFAPLIRDGKCYIDGGTLCSYPVQACLDDGREPETIFGLKKMVESKETVDDKSSLFDYLMVVFKNIMVLLNGSVVGTIPNEISFVGDHITIDGILAMASSKEQREQNIQMGVDAFLEMNTKTSKIETSE